MQIILAAVLLIGLGSLLVWQFWRGSLDEGEVEDVVEPSAAAEAQTEELKAA